jgi:competence protein ComEC
VPALAATVLGLLIADPALAADPGFGLSVLATAALVLVAPRWVARMCGRSADSPKVLRPRGDGRAVA